MNSNLASLSNRNNNANNEELNEFLREVMVQQAHYEDVYSMYMGGNSKTTPKSIVDTLPVRLISSDDLKK